MRIGHRLFKDVTPPATHVQTALGNQGKGKRKATLFSGIRKPNTGPTIDVDKAARKYMSEYFKAPELKSAVDKRVTWVSDYPTEKFAEVLKVDESLGLVFGWAIVCKKDGEPYFDSQDDFIPEDAMLAASTDFMGSGAMAKEMHAGEAAGAVLFAFPLTSDIAEAFGIESKTTGLMIALKPTDRGMLEKFRDGTYTGFSIGGFRINDEPVE